MMLFGFGRVPGCLGLGLFFCGMAGSLSVLFFGGVRCGGLPGGGVPSALRWMAAGAEFSCGVLGGGESSVVWWMAAGVEFPCDLSGGCVASALWWM